MKRNNSALSILVLFLIGIFAAVAGLSDVSSRLFELGTDELVSELLLAPSPTPKSPQITPDQDTQYTVVRIIDGDTIKVLVGEKEETVRLVNMNAPESVDPRRSVECMGTEASEQLSLLLKDQRVRLQVDSSQSDRDRYGRLLRFVLLPDGADVGLSMIRSGFAHSTPYGSTPHSFYDLYQDAQAAAQKQQLGLWDPTKCSEE